MRPAIPAISTERKWGQGAFVHGPAATGDCTVCHDSHGDDHPYMLWADPKFDICIACHKDKENIMQEQEGVHRARYTRSARLCGLPQSPCHGLPLSVDRPHQRHLCQLSPGPEGDQRGASRGQASHVWRGRSEPQGARTCLFELPQSPRWRVQIPSHRKSSGGSCLQ